MKLNRSRYGAGATAASLSSGLSAREGEGRGVDWLPRARRVNARRPGDLLVVVLASGVVILLGLVAVILRFGGEAAPRAAAIQPAPRAAQASAPAQSLAPPPPLARAPAAPPAASASPSAAASLPAAALASAPVAAARAIAPSTPLSEQPTALAFSAAPPPRAAIPMPAPVDEAPLASIPQAAPPAPPVRPASLRAEAPKPEGAKPEAAKPEAALRRGGPGATWAVYFDRFPDQKSVAAQINALQGKYGPHLGGRRLTYARASDKSWRVRVAGLTEEAAGEICEKVRKTGGACAIGGR